MEPRPGEEPGGGAWRRSRAPHAWFCLGSSGRLRDSTDSWSSASGSSSCLSLREEAQLLLHPGRPPGSPAHPPPHLSDDVAWAERRRFSVKTTSPASSRPAMAAMVRPESTRCTLSLSSGGWTRPPGPEAELTCRPAAPSSPGGGPNWKRKEEVAVSYRACPAPAPPPLPSERQRSRHASLLL